MFRHLTRIYWPEPVEGRELLAASGRIFAAFCLLAAASGTLVNIINLPYLPTYGAQIALAQAVAIGFASIPYFVNDRDDFQRRATIGSTILMILFIGLSLSIGNLVSSTNMLLLPAIAAVTLAIGWQFGLPTTLAAIATYVADFFIELNSMIGAAPDPAVLVALISAAIILFVGCAIYRREMQRTVRRIEYERMRAQEGDKAKTDFLAVMSHEVRTPMNGVIGMLQLLTTSDIPEEERDQAQTALMSAVSLLDILNNILDYSRNEAGGGGVHPADFNPADLFEETVGLFRPVAHAKHVSLDTTGLDTLPPIMTTDPDRLRQILANLVSNAVKFTDNGHVTVATRLTRAGDGSQWLHVEVEDTGAGVPPDQLTEIFEHFKQLEESTTRRHGGTGLGLAICRQLAEMLGGDIGVKSVVGQGSCFWFEIPCGLARIESLPAAK
jgi:signal transduction histidine kinase